jgi:hypothetical protein
MDVKKARHTCDCNRVHWNLDMRHEFDSLGEIYRWKNFKNNVLQNNYVTFCSGVA